MKRWLLGGFGLALVSLSATPVAGAQSTASTPSTASTAVCVHRWTDSVSPGLTLAPKTAIFTSNGETGTIDCIGQVKGRRVTGAGTFGEVGVFRGTCLSGSGSAVFSFTIPTTGGLAKFSFPVTFRLLAGVGSTSSAMFPGGFVAVPTAGDCVLTPATKIAVVRLGTLRS